MQNSGSTRKRAAFALKTIELVAKYLPRAVADGSDKEAREMMAYANTFAGYYMMYTARA